MLFINNNFIAKYINAVVFLFTFKKYNTSWCFHNIFNCMSKKFIVCLKKNDTKKRKKMKMTYLSKRNSKLYFYRRISEFRKILQDFLKAQKYLGK